MAVRVAVDAMGGDLAPHAAVAGSVDALEEHSDLELVLVGDRTRIAAELGDRKDVSTSRLRIIHASQVVGMNDAPIDSIRRKKDSSIVRAVELAVAGEVDAVVSAGNTGACAAACQLRIKPLPCINRPGIAVVIPAFHGPFVLCDVGANIAAKPRHLHDYAVMASLYAELIVGIDKPRTALVSIGEESGKGTGLVKRTHELLTRSAFIDYVGNAEGRELFENRCDVAICDGFVGNIILKFVEGLAEGLLRTIAREVDEEPPELRERFHGALNRVWQRHDYQRYGGAPLLGINGVCIICHGRSNATAIRNAVSVAIRFVEQGFNAELCARLGQPAGAEDRN